MMKPLENLQVWVVWPAWPELGLPGPLELKLARLARHSFSIFLNLLYLIQLLLRVSSSCIWQIFIGVQCFHRFQWEQRASCGMGELLTRHSTVFAGAACFMWDGGVVHHVGAEAALMACHWQTVSGRPITFVARLPSPGPLSARSPTRRAVLPATPRRRVLPMTRTRPPCSNPPLPERLGQPPEPRRVLPTTHLATARHQPPLASPPSPCHPALSPPATAAAARSVFSLPSSPRPSSASCLRLPIGGEGEDGAAVDRLLPAAEHHPRRLRRPPDLMCKLSARWRSAEMTLVLPLLTLKWRSETTWPLDSPAVMGSLLTTEMSSVTAWTVEATSDDDGTHRISESSLSSLICGGPIIGSGLGRKCTGRQPWLPSHLEMMEHR
ncbi:hypothetical protein ACLOJK_013184 [Asimina triloba]